MKVPQRGRRGEDRCLGEGGGGQEEDNGFLKGASTWPLRRGGGTWGR